MELIRDWFKKEKFNVLTTVLAGVLPVLLNWLWDIIKLLASGKWASPEGLAEVLSIFSISESANYAIQTVFVLLSLFVLIRNRRHAIHSMEDRKLMEKYIEDKCGLKIKQKDDAASSCQVVRGTVRQFYYAWLSLWFLWLVYYGGNLVYEIGENTIATHSTLFEKFNMERVQNLFCNFFDFLSSSVLYVVYLVLNNVTVNIAKRGGNSNGIRYGILFLTVLASIYMAATLIGLAVTDKESYMKINISVLLLLGMFSSLSFVLVLGKLNSNFLQIPRALMYVLYIYAVTQVYEPFLDVDIFREKNPVMVLSYIFPYITLCGKISLLLALSWMVYDRRLIFYVIHKSLALDETPSKLKSFNEYMTAGNPHITDKN